MTEARPAWDALNSVAGRNGLIVETCERRLDGRGQFVAVWLLEPSGRVVAASSVYGFRLGDVEAVRGRLSRDVLATWALSRLGVE